MEALADFIDQMEALYGDNCFPQDDFTCTLLTHLWNKGYKVVPLEQEDYDAH